MKLAIALLLLCAVGAFAQGYQTFIIYPPCAVSDFRHRLAQPFSILRQIVSAFLVLSIFIIFSSDHPLLHNAFSCSS
jgi:hypothetical protein